MPRQVDHAEQRSRLAEAAAMVIAGHGLDATGMREVAQASDLTTGAVTHYFPSKAVLIEAAYDAVMQRLLARQTEIGEAALAPAALIAQLADILPGDADSTRDWRVWLAFSARALVDDRLQARHREYYARIAVGLAADLGGSDDSPARADLIIAALDGLGVRMLLEPGAWPMARVEATLALLAPILIPEKGER